MDVDRSIPIWRFISGKGRNCKSISSSIIDLRKNLCITGMGRTYIFGSTGLFKFTQLESLSNKNIKLKWKASFFHKNT